MDTTWCGTWRNACFLSRASVVQLRHHLRQVCSHRSWAEGVFLFLFLFFTFLLQNSSSCAILLLFIASTTSILVTVALAATLTMYQMFRRYLTLACCWGAQMNLELQRCLWKNSALWRLPCNRCYFSWSQGDGEINVVVCRLQIARLCAASFVLRLCSRG